MTGATGFVGSNLKNYLGERGYTVIALKYSDHMEFKIPDGTDTVIHIAGRSHDLRHEGTWLDYYNSNCVFTQNMYDAFLPSDAKRFIWLSSVKAVTEDPVGTLTENIVACPHTHYGRSKLLAEEYITGKQLPPGKSAVILRPCMIHGPGNKGNLNLLFRMVANRYPYPLAAFENRRSFLSIGNLLFVIREIIERESAPSGIFNVADDEPLSTNEVVSLLSQAVGRKPRLLHVPRAWIRLLARIGDVSKLPLNTDRLQKLTGSFVVSNAKLKSAFNIELPVSARDGILQTALSFKRAGVSSRTVVSQKVEAA